MVISVFMLSNPFHKMLMQHMFVAGDHLKTWHTEQNRALRNCDGSCTWLANQTSA